MRLIALYLICFAFTTLLLGAMTFYRKKDRVTTLFSFFSLCVAGWALTMGIWLQETESLTKTFFLMRVSTAFATMVPLAWFHFTEIFVGKRWLNPRVYFVFYTVVISLMLLGLFHPGFVLPPNQVGFYLNAPYPGALYHFKTLLYVIFVPFGFFILADAFHNSKDEKKEQVKYFIIATFLGFAGGGNTIFSVYFRDAPTFLVPLILVYPFFMGFALIKYGLFEHKDIAEAVHRDKLVTIGTLAASLNHEIKNPLYVIQSLAESFLTTFQDGLLKDHPEKFNEQALAILTKSKEQAERATHIMNQFSSFAKQRVDETTKLQSVSLFKVIEQIVPLIYYEIKLDKIDFKNNIAPDFPTVFVDKNYAEEIFFNLMMNSCQAMKRTGGELTLSAKVNGAEVVVEIKDNGPGIAKRQLSQIFEPFYTTKEEGTGLGLYITKQLVERNHGSIRVESEEGKGTTFFIILPKA